MCIQWSVVSHTQEWCLSLVSDIHINGRQYPKWNKIKQERLGQETHVYYKMWKLQKVLTYKIMLIVVMKGRQGNGRQREFYERMPYLCAELFHWTFIIYTIHTC